MRNIGLGRIINIVAHEVVHTTDVIPEAGPETGGNTRKTNGRDRGARRVRVAVSDHVRGDTIIVAEANHPVTAADIITTKNVDENVPHPVRHVQPAVHQNTDHIIRNVPDDREAVAAIREPHIIFPITIITRSAI